MSAIIGVKKEMTQLFKEDGTIIPCTVVDVSGVKVIGRRSKEKDGYDAVILGLGEKRKVSQAEKGMYKKLKYVPRYVVEFRTDKQKDLAEKKVGETVFADAFKIGDNVNVSGVTKGKGFQGVVKRWGFHGGPRTHGQSDRERAAGSIGGGTTPGRVFKGKKMPGHMGARVKTISNLKIVDVDKDNSLICIRGSVPGARNSLLKVYKSN